MTTYRLHASLGYNLSLAARLQERRLEEALKSLGLTRTTWCILLAIGNERLEQPSDIARFVGIDRTATSRALRHMETRGMVARATGEGDRRTTRVTLTKQGAELIDHGTPFAIANNSAMRDKLTAAEHDEILRLLAKLTEGEDADLTSF